MRGIADPDTVVLIGEDGVCRSGWQPADVSKAAKLEPCDSLTGRDPNAPALIFKERAYVVVG